ncbi:MAG: sigma-70 family RNA polymerase sigma factor [Candidatus Hydrogenedentes bacterium]|nr:sigma-70 family RNA polymerase sigma factor [Candidatus Hydrogenedentota bacterium]
MNESELVTRILSGEESLFGQIVARYSGCVWTVCSGYVKNPSECEDVAQEVFVQCYRRLDTLRNPRALGAWLCQLARRHSLMWLRSASRRGQCLARYENMEAAPMMENGDGSRTELQEAVWNTVNGLPEAYREALLLRFAEGYSAEQAAAFLGISTAAMRKRTERAKHLVREEMWGHVGPALAKRRHSGTLEKGILAAIPFGAASWSSAAGVGGTTAATTALKGGTGTMFGKIAVMAVAASLTVFGGITALWVADAPDPGKEPFVAAQTQPAPEAVAVSALPEPAVESAAPPSLDTVPAVAVEAGDAPPSAVAPESAAPPAHVSGRISDGEGNPVANAEVFLEVGRGFDRNDISGRYRARTGPDGRYQIARVDRFGPGLLYADAEGFSMAFDVCDPAEGRMLRDVDVTLSPADQYVAGRVADEGGAPVAGASVECLYYGYDAEGLAETAMTGVTTGNIGGVKLVFTAADADGAFRLAIPNGGLCDFRVVHGGYGTGFFPRVPTGEENAVFTLKPGGAISGTVTDPEGRPVPNIAVRVAGEARPGGLTIDLARIQPLPAPPVMVTTDAGGAYLAEGLGGDFTYSVSVPDPKLDEIDRLPNGRGLRVIARMMCEFDQGTNGAGVLARKQGVRAQAGQTTAGVNLTVGEENFATLRGRVTDRATGRPACPVVITAAVYGGGNQNYFQAKQGGSAVTGLDGRYELRVWNVAGPGEFSVRHLYMTEGGGGGWQPEEELATVALGPGEVREMDFAVDAPILVPVRFVGADGRPREGIEAGMGTAGSGGGCGGVLVSGADGRVVFHGLRPGVAYQALAWLRAGSGIKTVGVSDPFSGEPGQTVPEVTVVCRLSGGIGGMLSHSDGRPVANTALLCGARGADGATLAADGVAMTDVSGYFQLPASLPEGDYAEVVVGFLDREMATPYSATAAGVEIAAGAVTDLGALVVAPEKDLALVVSAVGYDHISNAAIAGIYAPEALDTLSDPGAILKTGFALYDMERYAEALDLFLRLEEKADDDPLYQSVAVIWQGHMLDLLGRRQEALAAYAKAANMAVTDTVRHDQFGLSYQPSREAAARMAAPFGRVENREREP